MSWYALQHKAGQGDRAVLNLQNQQVPCFYPKIEVEHIRSGKLSRKLEPLFPGYLFINLEQTSPLWAKLRSTLGVLRIVSFSGKPALIEDAVIEQIVSSLETMTEQGGIKQGQIISLDSGPFKGIQAIFQAYDGEERAIVLITFMQQQQQVKVPVSALST